MTTAPSSSPSCRSWHPTAHRSTSSKPPERSSTTAGPSAPSRTEYPHPNIHATCVLTTSPSQHYNKKLRTLSLATEGAGADPATPARSATKRKAPASNKKADPTASPTPGAESGRGKKKVVAKAVSEEAVEREAEDDDDDESPTKKAKVDASGDASEGQE